jgi:hypothetical protein
MLILVVRNEVTTTPLALLVMSESLYRKDLTLKNQFHEHELVTKGGPGGTLCMTLILSLHKFVSGKNPFMIKDFQLFGIKRLPNYQYMDLCESQLMEARGWVEGLLGKECHCVFV